MINLQSVERSKCEHQLQLHSESSMKEETFPSHLSMTPKETRLHGRLRLRNLITITTCPYSLMVFVKQSTHMSSSQGKVSTICLSMEAPKSCQLSLSLSSPSKMP